MKNTDDLSNLNKIWHNYNQLRLTGQKKSANMLLEDFISVLQKQEKSVINDFVHQICSLTFDETTNILLNNGIEVSMRETRIQHQLFKKIVAPRLTELYLENDPLAIRWIGQFEQFYHSDYRIARKFADTVGLDDYYTRHFFEKSFKIDKNQKSLDLLLGTIASSIYFAIHEIPLGVLDTPDDYDAELKCFKDYLELSNNKNDWKKSVEKWTKIGFHWRTYFENRDVYANFQDYLAKNKIKITR